jgi:hypothetical protein
MVEIIMRRSVGRRRGAEKPIKTSVYRGYITR